MIHNRPEFTQPRVKTHWEARRRARSGVPGVARGRLRGVRAAFKKSRGFRSSADAIGYNAVKGSAFNAVPIRKRRGECFDVRPPWSRPCQ